VTRVYVPATDATLAELGTAGAVDASAAAFAVTPTLRAWATADSPADDEELELVALTEAARHSLRLLASVDGPRRRVVLAAEVEPADVTVVDEGPEAYLGMVRLDPAAVLVERVGAVLVDGPDVAALVVAAVAAVAAADDGDEAAETVVARLEDNDLLWFDPGEIGALTSG
jgi:hypothetical protein